MSRVENRKWRLLTGTGDETETCNLEQILMELVCTMIQKKGATDAGDPVEVTPVSCCSGFVSQRDAVRTGWFCGSSYVSKGCLDCMFPSA